MLREERALRMMLEWHALIDVEWKKKRKSRHRTGEDV
jgi:hypothetical protein